MKFNRTREEIIADLIEARDHRDMMVARLAEWRATYSDLMPETIDLAHDARSSEKVAHAREWELREYDLENGINFSDLYN